MGADGNFLLKRGTLGSKRGTQNDIRIRCSRFRLGQKKNRGRPRLQAIMTPIPTKLGFLQEPLKNGNQLGKKGAME